MTILLQNTKILELCNILQAGLQAFPIPRHGVSEVCMTTSTPVPDNSVTGAESRCHPHFWVQAQAQELQMESKSQDSKLNAIDLAELRIGNTKLLRGIEDRARQVIQQKLASGRSAKVSFPKSGPGRLSTM